MADIHDLRSYVAALEDAGQLARVKQPVSLEHELADVAASLARADVGAGLFENVVDSPWPVFCGGVTSHRRAAVALGCGTSEIIDVMERVLEPANGIAPVRVDSAAWHDNHSEGDDLDSAMLPIPTHSRGDGGAFITGALTVAKDPISGRGNLGYNRMQRLDANRFGFNVRPSCAWPINATRRPSACSPSWSATTSRCSRDRPGGSALARSSLTGTR